MGGNFVAGEGNVLKFMLDTNICVYVMKRNSEKALRKFQQIGVSNMCISSITLAELEYGIFKSQALIKNRLALSMFLVGMRIMPFGEREAEEYGKIRAILEKRGTPIGPMDMQIAAHAKALGLTLVTNNVREFARVDNLSIENWALS